jgi:hypothetical protein
MLPEILFISKCLWLASYFLKKLPLFRQVYKIAKNDYGIRHACLFLRVRGTTRIRHACLFLRVRGTTRIPPVK